MMTRDGRPTNSSAGGFAESQAAAARAEGGDVAPRAASTKAGAVSNRRARVPKCPRLVAMDELDEALTGMTPHVLVFRVGARESRAASPAPDVTPLRNACDRSV